MRSIKNISRILSGLFVVCFLLLFSLEVSHAAAGDYTQVDSTKRIAVSVKSNSGSDRCYLKDTPFEAGKTMGTVGKGGVIYISGKVINKHENTWYKTENGYFVYSGDVDIEVKDASFKVTSTSRSIAKVESKDYLYVKPFEASERSSIAKGEHVLLVEKIVNSYDNVWYKTSTGKYIYSGCISKPSEYLTLNSDKRLVQSTKASSSSDPCYLKKTPFEDGTTVSKKNKNDSFVVVAKVKNKYGHIWYKTENGYFVYSDDIKFPEFIIVSCSWNRAKSTKWNGGTDPCYIKKTPFEDGTTVRKEQKGNSFSIVGAVRNKYNNLWYKTSDGYYVYSGDVEVYTSTSSSDTNTNTGSSSSTNKNTLTITKQPASGYVIAGKKITVTVKATGDGLKYQWQAKEAGSNQWKNSSATTATYKSTITSEKSGRQVRCVITDKYGNKVTSNVATLRVIQITQQPKSATITSGEKCNVRITVSGSGVKYQWEARASSTAKWGTSSACGTTYKATITKANSGRQVRCKITDNYGNYVYSNIVTLKAK